MATLAAIGWLVLAAQDSVPSEWGPWLNLGVTGALVVLFLTGRIHIGSELKEARKERDEALTDSRQLRDAMLQDVVPAMTRMTEAATRATEALIRKGGQ